MSKRVFISYASVDRHWVNQLAEALQQAGWDAWIDHEAISGGAEWRTSIVRGLKTADVVLFVLSPASAASKNVVKELSLAEEFGLRLVPVVKEPTQEGSDMKYQLAGLQRIPFHDRPFDHSLARLLDALMPPVRSTAEIRVVPAAATGQRPLATPSAPRPLAPRPPASRPPPSRDPARDPARSPVRPSQGAAARRRRPPRRRRTGPGIVSSLLLLVGSLVVSGVLIFGVAGVPMPAPLANLVDSVRGAVSGGDAATPDALPER